MSVLCPYSIPLPILFRLLFRQLIRLEKITRSPSEAHSILTAHEQRIKSGTITLGELAASESDCSSARKHGDLGYFGRGEMQPEFEEAAFKLKVGEMSPIVSSQSGLHLIERVA